MPCLIIHIEKVIFTEICNYMLRMLISLIRVYVNGGDKSESSWLEQKLKLKDFQLGS